MYQLVNPAGIQSRAIWRIGIQKKCCWAPPVVVNLLPSACSHAGLPGTGYTSDVMEEQDDFLEVRTVFID